MPDIGPAWARRFLQSDSLRTSDSAVRLCLELRGGKDECTLSCRTQPSRARRTHGASERRQAFGAQAQASADFAGRRRGNQRRGHRDQRWRWRLDRIPDQAPLCDRQLGEALSEEPRPGADRKLSGKEEALLVATACSSPPEGRARWTLELLANELVRLTEHDSISRETVRRRLAENDLKPWRKNMWCIPHVDGEDVARMEDVLDLYAEVPDPKRPVVCFDESPTQLIGEVRQPIPAEPGQLERYDCEYKRNGTVNLFIFLDVHRPWRKVKVTERRTAKDFAICMRELSDVHFPEAARIRVVLDNLSTHSAGALYQAFPACEARRVLRRLEFHYVPKHASWLNMVEIEIGVLRGQCLDRRIATQEKLVSEIAAWERQRNTTGARINWMFTTEKARAKMGRAYPTEVSDPGSNERIITSVQRY